MTNEYKKRQQERKAEFFGYANLTAGFLYLGGQVIRKTYKYVILAVTSGMTELCSMKEGTLGKCFGEVI
jgi:hypothetical protein